MRYSLPNSLKEIRCYYLDHKLASKDYIDKLPDLMGDISSKFGKTLFILSTCLRYEIYYFSGTERNFKNKKDFVSISGSRCVRRLLALLCGLQSEIIGEREIFLQSRAAVYEAAKNKMLGKDLFWDINILFKIAENIRNKYNLTSLENYSTVGAQLLKEKIKDQSTVAIVGGGYMVESFLKNIDVDKLKKIIWVNRSVDKVRKIAKDLGTISINLFEFCSLDGAEEKIKQADFIFAASRDCGGIFSSLVLDKTKCVVDVSYPALFSENVGCDLYTINNTYFEKFVKNPVAKKIVLKAEKEIDNIILDYAD